MRAPRRPRTPAAPPDRPRTGDLASSDSVSLKKVVDVFYDKVGLAWRLVARAVGCCGLLWVAVGCWGWAWVRTTGPA